MKRNTVGDITALVVQVEKLTISSGSGKRPALRTQTRHNVRTRVDKLNKAPAITYKYNRRNANKYQSTVLIGMVIVSVVVLFGILFLMISSLMNTGRENAHNNTPTTTVSPSTSPTMSPGETDLPTEEPDETPDPGETPEPTPTPTPQSNIQTHVVKKGDSMSAITRQYYGDTTLLDKLCKYNNISDPDKIIQGQVIKIPPKEVLKEQD
jgi:nucleoid-associated protein YgaU